MEVKTFMNRASCIMNRGKEGGKFLKKHGKNPNQHFEKLVARFSELPEIEKKACLDMRAFLHMVDVSVELDPWVPEPQSCLSYPTMITQKQLKTHLCFSLSEIQRIGSSAKRLHQRMLLSLCLGLSFLTLMLAVKGVRPLISLIS